MINADVGLKQAFLAAGPQETLARMRSDPAFSAVLEGFEDYVQEYGVRGSMR